MLPDSRGAGTCDFSALHFALSPLTYIATPRTLCGMGRMENQSAPLQRKASFSALKNHGRWDHSSARVLLCLKAWCHSSSVSLALPPATASVVTSVRFCRGWQHRTAPGLWADGRMLDEQSHQRKAGFEGFSISFHNPLRALLSYLSWASGPLARSWLTGK